MNIKKDARFNTRTDQVHREIEKAITICKKNYFHYPNVIGIGGGLKCTNHKWNRKTLAVHFYVKEKRGEAELEGKILPKFVYARFEDGSIDFSNKVPTDVIQIKEPEFTCGAGTIVGVIGEQGTLSLVFQNKAGDKAKFFALTCAHVAGDIRRSPPSNPNMASSCCANTPIFAITRANSIHQNQRLAYDIALAEINGQCDSFEELTVAGSSKKISRFFPSRTIRAGMTLSCAMPFSHMVSTTVVGFNSALRLPYDGVMYEVSNLYTFKGAPRRGDSGGLLYRGSDAVGLVVAAGAGVGFFQSLGDAFEHLRTISPVLIQCFN